VAGKWWPKDYSGPPQVSIEEGAAKGLGLSLGDKVVINVLGRNVEAEIANFRRVKWESLSINFVMIFSPNTLQAAPFKMLATLSLPSNEGAKTEARLLARLIQDFPGITPIGVRDTLLAINSVVEQILLAIRLASGVLLLAGAIALAGALAATHQQRLHETVIFKVLGATRRRILTAHAIEYSALALISAVIASVIGSLAGYLIVRQVMRFDFSFAWWSVWQVCLLVVLLILPIGLYGTWRVLGRKATAQLRRE
jgi:putative ABC transport system permease protein